MAVTGQITGVSLSGNAVTAGVAVTMPDASIVEFTVSVPVTLPVTAAQFPAIKAGIIAAVKEAYLAQVQPAPVNVSISGSVGF